jgi:hypothetical protein
LKLFSKAKTDSKKNWARLFQKPGSTPPATTTTITTTTHKPTFSLQGELDPNKISGLGTNFGLLLYVLPGPNKQRACKPSMI